MCERSKRGLNPSLSLPIVLPQLPQWIEDYNEVHPHRGLRMHSPREYRRLNSTR
jgi:transposase InsO family protein